MSQLDVIERLEAKLIRNGESRDHIQQVFNIAVDIDNYISILKSMLNKWE